MGRKGRGVETYFLMANVCIAINFPSCIHKEKSSPAFLQPFLSGNSVVTVKSWCLSNKKKILVNVARQR